MTLRPPDMNTHDLGYSVDPQVRGSSQALGKGKEVIVRADDFWKHAEIWIKL